MRFTLWCVVIGLLMVVMALSSTVMKRLPLSTALLYLAIGYGLGPAYAGLFRLDQVGDSSLPEHFAEVAVIVSLFTAGLKLRMPLNDRRWWLPVRLASFSMAITVGLVAAAGVLG